MTRSNVKHIKDKRPSLLRRTFHLQHRRHTGKLLHHKHTSHRGLAMVIVLAGILIVCLHIDARTADAADPLVLTVSARNPAPIPTTAAVITQPVTGSVTQTPTITVSGTCPGITPPVSVAIVDNGTIVGSTPCTSDNTFTLIITLSLGQNTLIARTFTITGDSGPDSAPVLVTYTPSAPPATNTTVPTTISGGGSAARPSASGVAPLVVTINEPFIIFGPNKAAVFTGTISGGVAPYAIHVDWGDGVEATYIQKTAGDIQFTHHYLRMQAYVITLHATDQSHQTVISQYAAVTPYKAPIVGGTITPPTSCGPFCGLSPFAIYGGYLLLLAGFGYLWIHAHPFEYASVPVHSHNIAGSRGRRVRRR